MTEERVQRRLAAILAADVAGYSRLIGEDEAGTLAQLKVLRKEVFDPRIAEHNGRIVKTTGTAYLSSSRARWTLPNALSRFKTSFAEAQQGSHQTPNDHGACSI